jgi:hypothetical protein
VHERDEPNNSTQGDHLQVTLFQSTSQAVVDDNTIGCDPDLLLVERLHGSAFD